MVSDMLKTNDYHPHLAFLNRERNNHVRNTCGSSKSSIASQETVTTQ